MVSTNQRAMKVVEELLENAEALGCKVVKLDCGATVIDLGLNCRGSWQAGVLFTRACIGDLGVVSLSDFKLNDLRRASKWYSPTGRPGSQMSP